MKMIQTLKNLVVQEEGQGMVEYGLIISLVALVAAAAFTLLSGDISALLGKIGQKLNPTTP